MYDFKIRPKLNKWIISAFKPILIVSLLCTGCGNKGLKDTNLDYQTVNAKKSAPLVVPPEFAKPKQDDRYDIPQAGSSSFSEYSQSAAQERSLYRSRDGGQEILPLVDGVEVKGDGRMRWIVVDKSVELIWPRVKKFWQNNGFIIERNMPNVGILETEWTERQGSTPASTGINKLFDNILENLNSYPQRDKFKTRLELGEKDQSVEIYITHQSMIEKRLKVSVDTLRKNWEVVPADTELEAEMLYRLSIWLGVEEDRALAIKNKKLSNDDNKVFEAGENEPSYLLVKKEFGRAWRSVGIALDRLGFTLDDRDRSKGVYYVRYIDLSTKKQKKSFLARLFSFGKPKKSKEVKYQVYVENSASAQSLVKIMDAQGNFVENGVSLPILNLMRDQL